MKRFFTILLASAGILATITGCGGRSSAKLLPNVSGKAGEILVVIDKDTWEGNTGIELRSLLECDCPFLAQRERLFNLSNVPPGSFTSMFKVHRNLILVNINPQNKTQGVVYRSNVWARPQSLVELNAFDGDGAVALLREEGQKISEYFEQAERDRIIANALLYEAYDLREPVSTLTGGHMVFPSGYKLKKQTDDFVWIADDKQYTLQDILVMRYPVSGGDLEQENLVKAIDQGLKDNVPGMFDNTWMVTSQAMPVSSASLSYRGLDFVQLRGFWEVYNDFMGGPFVAHAFYSPDGGDIIVLYAFVYAPKYDKRQYLRQVESVLYSFAFDKAENKEK